MTFKLYLWGLIFAAALSFAGWIWVIIYINPETAGVAGQFVFYLSLFFGLAGIFIFLLTWLRCRRKDKKQAIELSQSFRQGFLLALMVLIVLILQSARLLVWWDALLVLAAILLLELYFLSRQQKNF